MSTLLTTFCKMFSSFLEFASGPNNQTVEVDGKDFTENCVVLNATGIEWGDVRQHTIGDVTCCEDLRVTLAICERRKESINSSL